MGKLLIVYGTVDGHTRRIAERVADVAREYGHTPYLVDAAAQPMLSRADNWEAVIVCAPIRVQKHPKPVARFVTRNLRLLQHLPSAFFSVSLAVAGGDEKGARKCVGRFLQKTGWHPAMVRLVGGALLYRRYGFFMRRIMRAIAKRSGGDTDTAHDYEYTDWVALREDVEEFLLGAVPVPRPARERMAGV
jgi:menaquinone-dependent protoporphyrinogen oxidase